MKKISPPWLLTRLGFTNHDRIKIPALNASNPEQTLMAMGRLLIAFDSESLTKPMTGGYRCERRFWEDIGQDRRGCRWLHRSHPGVRLVRRRQVCRKYDKSTGFRARKIGEFRVRLGYSRSPWWVPQSKRHMRRPTYADTLCNGNLLTGSCLS